MYFGELKTVIFFAMAVLIGGGLLITGASLIWSELFAGRRSVKAYMDHDEKGDPRIRATTHQHSAIIRDEVRKAKREREESVTKRIIMTEAEMAKLHARDAYWDEAWGTAALCWSRALKEYVDLDEQTLLGIAVQRLRGNLDKCQMIDEKVRKEIGACLPLIPDVLKSERDVIEERLKELAKPAEREAA